MKVYFLFDEIGSHKLPRRFLKELKAAGVECHSFGINRYWWSRFQLNFRNHRKIVVSDGKVALIGGLNVGDEYMGRDQRFGEWRDTHLEMRGPVVQAVQLVFLEDWFWAANRVPDLHWDTQPEAADQVAAMIPTGPADPADSWQLIVAEAANSARRKLWIASPYFVPDEGVLTALQTAAIRGVDVRILLPERADHLLVWLSAFSYYEQSIPYGIKLFRYHTRIPPSEGDAHRRAAGRGRHGESRQPLVPPEFRNHRLLDRPELRGRGDGHARRGFQTRARSEGGGLHRQAVPVPRRLPRGEVVRTGAIDFSWLFSGEKPLDRSV